MAGWASAGLRMRDHTLRQMTFVLRHVGVRVRISEMAAVVDKFEFKRLVLKATPRLGDAEETREAGFWKKFKVRANARWEDHVTYLSSFFCLVSNRR